MTFVRLKGKVMRRIYNKQYCDYIEGLCNNVATFLQKSFATASELPMPPIGLPACRPEAIAYKRLPCGRDKKLKASCLTT